MKFINKIKEECVSLQLGMSNEQINALIDISKEDLVEGFGFYSEDTLYRLSLCNVKIYWCRFIKQYSNNPLNEILDVDSIINDEITKTKTIFKNMKELVEKYEKMYFLEWIPEKNKLELSQLYEDFTNFLIKLDEKHSVVGNRFEIIFIPIIKKLYIEFKETNYVLVYEMYKTWYSESGFKDGVTKTDILEETLKSDDYHFNGFIEYYKSLKVYIDDTVKNEISKYTVYDNLNGGISKPEYKFTVLIKTLNFENKTGDEIKLIIDEAGLLLNYENCYVTMFAIGKLNGEVFSVNETDDDFVVLDKHLSDGKTIVLYSAKIEDGKVFYRYSLIEDKPLDRLEEIKKRVDKSDNVLLFDKHELESLKKITKTTKISEYEVLTDDGFVDIEALHETIPYEVYHLKLSDSKELKCADNHIVFVTEYHETTFEPIGLTEIFVKDLQIGSFIMVSDDNGNLTESEVIEVTNLGYEEVMYDLELKEGSNRRYYTNGILSHNTLFAKLLAEHVYGDAEALVRVDMSEYMEKHSVSRLVGPPPGYVGYDQGGQLTEKVRRKPHCVILFDEIEKAHDDVFNLLLQLLDEGHLTDGLGRKINFKNALIIMTSNIGVREANSFGKSMGFETGSSSFNEESKSRAIIDKALKKKFKPEFLNRIDEAIIFNSLSKENIREIINIEIKHLEKRLAELKFDLDISEEALDFIAKQGYDEEYGARPLNRAIQHYVEDLVADEILTEVFEEGDTIKIVYSKDSETLIIDKPKETKKQ
jgi:hypothetical protein